MNGAGWQDNAVNVMNGAFQGLQFGLVNYAGHMEGLQLGFVNYAGSIEGLQIGVANIISEGGMLPFMIIVNGGF